MPNGVDIALAERRSYGDSLLQLAGGATPAPACSALRYELAKMRKKNHVVRVSNSLLDPIGRTTPSEVNKGRRRKQIESPLMGT